MSLVIPVIAVLLGAAIRAETPGPGTVLGAALVLGGVSLTLFVGRR
jgi:drug/metabolite transporter (DMT)-like permease